MGKLYDDNSIESLSPLQFTRLRPGVYCGSTEYSTQLLIEIVSNAIDEYAAGHGSVINVDYRDDGYCRVEDFAQGFPVNVLREDGETVLQASFDVINTSGKYRDDGVYEGTAIGLNGIGSKLTNFLSHKLIVRSYNLKGEWEEIVFEEGIFKNRTTGTEKGHASGTIVTFWPSEEFFTSPKVNEKKLRDFCEDITCLCPGLTIIFNEDKRLKENKKLARQLHIAAVPLQTLLPTLIADLQQLARILLALNLRSLAFLINGQKSRVF